MRYVDTRMTSEAIKYTEMSYLGTYRILCGCDGIDKEMRGLIMSSAYYSESFDVYKDFYEEEKIEVLVFYTKEGEVIAELRGEGSMSESELVAFNRNVRVSEIDRMRIVRHWGEMDAKRKKEKEKHVKYLNHISEERNMIQKIKEKTFYTTKSERESPKGPLNERVVVFYDENLRGIASYKESLFEGGYQSPDCYYIKGELKGKLKEGFLEYYQLEISKTL